jgi:hypothetical protein
MNRWNGPLKRYAETVARETGRLIATLATNDDARMRIDWLLDLVFVAAIDELADRGVPRRVAADMLGMSHRTLQRQYASAEESITRVGQSIWSNVIEHLRKTPMSREELGARSKHVPPVVLASVLNDMAESGWITEQNGVLRLVPQTPQRMSDQALRRHIVIRRRSDPAVRPEDIAADIDHDLDHVRRMWDLSDSIEIEASGFAVWIAMERCYRSTMTLLRESADNPHDPKHTATTWRVRLDDKPPETQEKFMGFMGGVRSSIQEIVRPVKTRYEDDEGARFWTFTAFQTNDLE